MKARIVDALCFEARLNLETLDNLDTPIAELRAVGDGARCRRILELKASVMDRPISTLRVSEASLLGAAMLAQAASGIYANLREAALDCVRLQSTIEPNRKIREAYETPTDVTASFTRLFGITIITGAIGEEPPSLREASGRFRLIGGQSARIDRRG